MRTWIAIAAAAAWLAACSDGAAARPGASDVASEVASGATTDADAATAQGDAVDADQGDAADAAGPDAAGDAAGSDASAGADAPSDATAGACVHDGDPCDDGDACTEADRCQAGSCQPGAAKVCKGNDCNKASCDVSKGCVFEELDVPCDDGSSCTKADACKAGTCQGQPLICDDGNACTFDTCDVGSGCKSVAEADDVPCGAGKVCYGGACTASGTIFAHSASQLYRLELKKKSFDLVGSFQFDKNAGEVTDIALDRTDTMVAITFNDLFQCKTKSAQCAWIMGLPQSFNGMTFVPTGTVFADRDALIGIANSGDWYLVDFLAQPPIVKKLGSYGGLYGSSGDAFSVKGVGTFATVTKFGAAADLLVEVDPLTGKVIKEIGSTGVSNLWGVAWWQGVAYAFGSSGSAYALDLKTGKATALSGYAIPKVSWWGAGVSTEAGAP